MTKEQRKLFSYARGMRLKTKNSIPKTDEISKFSVMSLNAKIDSISLIGNTLSELKYDLNNELPKIKDKNIKKSYKREIKLQENNLGYIDRKINNMKNKRRQMLRSKMR
jgi:hypothetical protein